MNKISCYEAVHKYFIEESIYYRWGGPVTRQPSHIKMWVDYSESAIRRVLKKLVLSGFLVEKAGTDWTGKSYTFPGIYLESVPPVVSAFNDAVDEVMLEVASGDDETAEAAMNVIMDELEGR